MKNRPSKSISDGFSLLELMVILVIAGILAMAGGIMLNSATSKLKGVAFGLRGDLGMARGEAVNRNVSVRVDFIRDNDATPVDIDGDGDNDDGYRIWIDSNLNDGIYTAGADILIKEVAFRDEVEFYDAAGVDGPDKEADSDQGLWGANTDSDGIRIGDDTDVAPGDNGVNFFTMQPNGTVLPNQGGTVYFYVPEAGSPTQMLAPPIAIDVNPSGRVSLQRWSTNETKWGTK